MEAGFVNGQYANVFASVEQCAQIIADKRVGAVKFVGSTKGGKSVAAIAGQHMKRGTFELGGSDPFVVLEDADLNLAVEKALAGRLGNNG